MKYTPGFWSVSVNTSCGAHGRAPGITADNARLIAIFSTSTFEFRHHINTPKVASSLQMARAGTTAIWSRRVPLPRYLKRVVRGISKCARLAGRRIRSTAQSRTPQSIAGSRPGWARQGGRSVTTSPVSDTEAEPMTISLTADVVTRDTVDILPSRMAAALGDVGAGSDVVNDRPRLYRLLCRTFVIEVD